MKWKPRCNGFSLNITAMLLPIELINADFCLGEQLMLLWKYFLQFFFNSYSVLILVVSWRHNITTTYINNSKNEQNIRIYNFKHGICRIVTSRRRERTRLEHANERKRKKMVEVFMVIEIYFREILLLWRRIEFLYIPTFKIISIKPDLVGTYIAAATSH